MLHCLTFTGIDTQTDPGRIRSIHQQHPRTEFGILVSGHSGEHNRYPPIDVVRTWAASHGGEIPLALHLCGPWARFALSAELDDGLLGLCDGFGRVQINSGGTDYAAVNSFAEAVSARQVILQRRGPVDHATGSGELHPKIVFLHDRSGGRGVSSVGSWDRPPAEHLTTGYAGGLGPDNIAQAVSFANRHPAHRIWLDMESRVRDSDDWLDTDLIAEVCSAAF